MSDLEQLLVSRSLEGTPRGAPTVWAGAVGREPTEWSDRQIDAEPGLPEPRDYQFAAEDPQDLYVADDLQIPDGRRWAWMAAAALVILIAGAAVLAASGLNGDSTPADTPTTMSIPTAQERADAEALRLQQLADGWMPYHNKDYFSGEWVDGWIRASLDAPCSSDCGGAMIAGEGAPGGNGFKVYDSQNGTLIGYQLNSLGFVPLDRINEVNGSQARIDKYGCDPSADNMTDRKTCQDALTPEATAGSPG